MGARSVRPPPDLDSSSLVHAGGNLFVDNASGMVLSRVGYVHQASGYEKLSIDGAVVSAHRFVWEAIHGSIPPGLTVNHVDGDKANNRPDNLELATQSEQISHAYALGLRVGNGRLGKPGRSRLSPEQVRQIKEAPRGTITTLARELGISRRYAYDIRRGIRLAVGR
jgi:hypothetical protein